MAKSKLPPRSGSLALRQLNPIHKKGRKSLKFFLKPMLRFYTPKNVRKPLYVFMGCGNGALAYNWLIVN